MAIKAKVDADPDMNIKPLDQAEVTFTIIGQAPLIYNAMSMKAKQTLLAGGGKKTEAEKKHLKHDPVKEFQDCIYKHDNPETYLCFPSPGIKAAMATAALETEGVKKTSVQRLIYMPEHSIKIWGRPYLRCDVVRSADMNRTPDIRTRCFLPEWAAQVTVRYIRPTLTAMSVANLLQNAGMIIGIGDFRQEKGKGSFGTFTLASEDNDLDMLHFATIKKNGDRAAQIEGMKLAEPHDGDYTTLELLDFIKVEQKRRAA